MPIPVHKLPRPILSTFGALSSAVARIPGFTPPTIDGYRLDDEVALGMRVHYAADPTPLHSLTPAQARAEHLDQAGPYQPHAKRPIPTMDIVLDGVPARLYRGGESALMWIHGGGFVIGSIAADDAVCKWVVEQTGLSIVSIDYRLAPEHPFPAAHDDALRAWIALQSRAEDLGLDADRMGIAGSSAGGNLAASTCIAARDADAPMPAYQLLFYPATDFTASQRSHETLADGYALDKPLIDWFKHNYATPEQWLDPRISLNFVEDLSGLPPAHVITAGFDPLRDEGCLFASQLRDAGNQVWYECAGGLIHSFVDLSGLSKTSRDVTLRAFQVAADALAPGPSLAPQFERPRVCIIGAGTCGLSAAKSLQDAGVPFVVYEASDRVGGLWVFNNKNGRSAAYRSLHINTSRQAMEFRDFPMPEHYPDYPHHSLIAEYFDAYADHFGLRRHIAFNTWVSAVEPVAGDGARGAHGWDVTLADGTVERFDSVLVGNGHHWDPYLPDPPYPGPFAGKQIHASEYVDPAEPLELIDKNVVVVGFGNSAMDIACELSQRGIAHKVFLSVRTGGYVLPHYLLGVPTDQFGKQTPSIIPNGLARRGLGLIHRTVVGKMESFGLPTPPHRILDAHPTISSELLPRIGRGDITVKPNIASFDEEFINFEDGTREVVDAVIWCTGYNVKFPFISPDLIAAPKNEIDLYKHMVPTDIRGLFFLGLVQPLGAVMPLVEQQTKWIADLLTNDAALPTTDEMNRDIDNTREAMRKRYGDSRRHTLQVDFQPYLDELHAAHKAGRRRAQQ